MHELGSMLQKEVMVSFKIQCCYSPVVTEDNHERSGQSAYMEYAKRKPQIHTPMSKLHIV